MEARQEGVLMPARFAVYYAPQENSPLHDFARSWLGRDAQTGREIPLNDGAYLPASVLREVTASPRHYGFHATLKPPFVLAPGRTVPELVREAASFAKETVPLDLPSLVLKWIGGFLAIVPGEEPQGLQELAAQCVRRFDGFRAPPGPEETKKRLAAGLSQRQQELLAQWGYPYVMEEYRLHLTLSNRLRDEELKDKLWREADLRLGNILDNGLALDSICLFRQPDLDRPFSLAERFALTGA